MTNLGESYVASVGEDDDAKCRYFFSVLDRGKRQRYLKANWRKVIVGQLKDRSSKARRLVHVSGGKHNALCSNGWFLVVQCRLNLLGAERTKTVKCPQGMHSCGRDITAGDQPA